MWDFDEVIYAVLPPGLRESGIMCWLHGWDEYESNGGDDRLQSAARSLANN
jgi:hypothetical protein